MEPVTATTNGKVLIARRTLSLAQTTVLDRESAPKPWESVNASKNIMVSHAKNGFMPAVVLLPILAATIALEMVFVSTSSLVTPLWPSAAFVHQIRLVLIAKRNVKLDAMVMDDVLTEYVLVKMGGLDLVVDGRNVQ